MWVNLPKGRSGQGGENTTASMILNIHDHGFLLIRSISEKYQNEGFMVRVQNEEMRRTIESILVIDYIIIFRVQKNNHEDT